MPAPGPQTALISHFKVLLNSFSRVYFLGKPWVGAIFLVLSLANPHLAISGLLAVVAGYGFAYLMGMGKEFLESGVYTYNTLLVGLGVGSIYRLTPLSVLILLMAGLLTLAITLALSRVFNAYLALPILSLPFVVVIAAVSLASGKYSNLYISSLYPSANLLPSPDWPAWATGYFKCLAAIFFLPHPYVGLGIALVLLAASPILFGLSLTGYFTGSLVSGLMTGSFQQSFLNLNHFNFILIGMALGGVFLVPSRVSFLVSLIGVSCSVLLVDAVQAFWSSYGLPVLTLPFNLVALTFVYALGAVKFPYVSRRILGSPEESLDFHRSVALRFDPCPIGINLPFTGAWTVWQGFEGPWTHQGNWRHAYDFILTDGKGQSFTGTGKRLEDYLAYKKPVLSPIAGQVVKRVDNLPDQEIGQTDSRNNWGNLVVIRSNFGYHVEISHLAKDSLKVKEGDWVERGTLLGLCGNSGYSPQPHIHLQVQSGPDPGSATLDFRLTCYLSGQSYFTAGQPGKDEVLTPLGQAGPEPFVLDQEIEIESFYQGNSRGTRTLLVRMDAEGTLFFETAHGKLYFGRVHDGHCHFSLQGQDRVLSSLFLALPRLPLGSCSDYVYEESLPLNLLYPGWLRRWLLLGGALFNLPKSPKGVYRYKRGVLTGFISGPLGRKFNTEIHLDPVVGFNKFQVGDWVFQRKENEKT